MGRAVRLLLGLSLLVVGCGNPATDGGLDPNGTTHFNPCKPNPSHGFDPVKEKLPECCTHAHCVTKTVVPAVLVSSLAPCEVRGGEGLCLPDKAILHGVDYRPAECTSSVGKTPGVCLSMCIPRVANDPQSGLLGQDGCDDNELCV